MFDNGDGELFTKPHERMKMSCVAQFQNFELRMVRLMAAPTWRHSMWWNWPGPTSAKSWKETPSKRMFVGTCPLMLAICESLETGTGEKTWPPMTCTFEAPVT